jgi:excisionase family DNA binding protein
METVLLYDLDETASLLKVTRATLYKLLGSKELGSIYIGRHRFVPRVDLAAFIESKRAEAQLPLRYPDRRTVFDVLDDDTSQNEGEEADG